MRAGSVEKDVRGQKGQILVLVAIMMPVMLAFVGMVLDGGFIYAETRRAQAAADAIALTAATHMWYNTAGSVDCTTATGSGTDTCGVLAYATALGYTAANNATVTVTHPAEVSGTYASAEYHSRGDYVKVRVQQTIPKFLIGIIFEGLSQADMTAIAGIARVPLEYALVALGDPCTSADNGTSPAVNGGIVVSGSGDLTVNNGAMFSNCTGDPAVNVTGAGSIDSDGIQTSGECSAGLSCEEGLAQISDPMGNLAWPCSTAATGNNATSTLNYGYCTNRGSITGNVGNIVLNPGTYTEVNPTGNSTLWLRSGVYVIKGGVSDQGLDFGGTTGIRDCSASGAPSGGAPPGNTGTVSGGYGCTGDTGGVLVFNGTTEYDPTRSPSNDVDTLPNPCNDNTSPDPTGSPINFTGNGGFVISAKTSGTYAGLAVWQGCNLDDTLSFTGNSGSSITGTVYAPDALVDLDGSASWSTPSNIISNYTRLKGSADLTINYNHSLAYRPWKVVLVQ